MIVPKPIFVIRLNGKMEEVARTSIFANTRLEMPELFEQYHVLFASGENKHIEFECYNTDDIPDEIRDKTLAAIIDIISKQS